MSSPLYEFRDLKEILISLREIFISRIQNLEKELVKTNKELAEIKLIVSNIESGFKSSEI